MGRFVARIGIVLAVASVAAPTPRRAEARETDPVQRAVECQVLALMEAQGLPSVALALVEGGHVRWAKGWGFVNRLFDTPATAETVYETQSLVKPMTAVAVLSMLKVPTCLTLSQYIRKTPLDEVLPGIDPEKEVTLSELLAHRVEPSRVKNPDAEELWSLDPLQSMASSFPVWRVQPYNTPPHNYRNETYVIAGALLAHQVIDANGSTEPVDWKMCERGLRSSVWDPSSMRDTSLVMSPSMLERLALPYGCKQSAFPLETTWWFRQASARGAHATVTDLARFLGACLSEGKFDGRQVLARDAVVVAEETPEVPIPTGFTIGHGWWRQREGASDLIRHRGLGDQSHGIMYGDLVDGRGVVMLTNSAGFVPKNVSSDMEQVAAIALRAMRGDSTLIANCDELGDPHAAGLAGTYVDLEHEQAWPPNVALVRGTSVGLLIELRGRYGLLARKAGGDEDSYEFLDKGVARPVTFGSADGRRTLSIGGGLTFERRVSATLLPLEPPTSAKLAVFDGRWTARLTALPLPKPQADPAPDVGSSIAPEPPPEILLDVILSGATPRVLLSQSHGPAGGEPAVRINSDGRTLHVEFDTCEGVAPIWLDVRREGEALAGFMRQGIRVDPIAAAKEIPPLAPDVSLAGRWEGTLWEPSSTGASAGTSVPLTIWVPEEGPGTMTWGGQAEGKGSLARGPMQRDTAELALSDALPSALFGLVHLRVEAPRMHGLARGGRVRCASIELRRISAPSTVTH
jgi:CubicO group peptidase (beta-lactamase class C family)